ncbi:MAG: 3-deoxy-7-phosphoheptulonate synthase [Desulfobacteraceae bacterium]
MILVLENGITQNEKNKIKSVLSSDGCITREIADAGQNILGVIGKGGKDPDYFRGIDGIADVVPVSTSYKLVSRQMHKSDSRVKVKDVIVGGDRIVVVAGPCAVESREQALAVAKEVRKYGAVLFRGGAFKPRSSPYSFQGLEEEGLKILAEVREKTGLAVITEITSPAQADLMVKYVDAVQVGARNMQNFELLKCVGRIGKPVVLKRGLASTIEEWLMSAEYIMAEGNDDVILCERGIRTFEPYTRNTLDLSAIPVLKKLTHLPVIIDPSHATGIREKVSPMARSAVAAGADALMIEVHNDPDKALSDGPQSLYPEQFGKLMRDLYAIAPVVGKQLDFSYLDKAEAAKNSENGGYGVPQKASMIGELGTFSHKAAIQYFGETIDPVPKQSFKAVFEAVNSNETEYGIVPIENSLSGSIHENYDLLLEYDLKIVGEVTIRVVHSLIAHPGVDRQNIEKVLAPPPAFQQCKAYLDQHGHLVQVPVKATASAVKEVLDSGDKTGAAIGSAMSADIFGMDVLEEGIEDNPRNFTRFFIIGKQILGSVKKSKSSIVFSTGNKPGALFSVMKVFSDNGINLVKLESRPIHGKPWEYMFYADLETDVTSEAFSGIKAELEEKTDYIKILGAY